MAATIAGWLRVRLKRVIPLFERNPRMHVTPEWAEEHWAQLVRDAGLGIERVQLVVVRDVQPAGRAECAYCQPSFLRMLDDPEVYLVVRRIGDHAYDNHHVVAVWQELPNRDEIATLALLRHELEHALQWEHWGQGVVDELDPELKALTGRDDGESYHEAPLERAADDAARNWVRRNHGTDEAARLTDQVFPYWPGVPEGARNADLLADTVAALRSAAPAAYEVSMPNQPPVPLDTFIERHGKRDQLQATARTEQPIVEFVD